MTAKNEILMLIESYKQLIRAYDITIKNLPIDKAISYVARKDMLMLVISDLEKIARNSL